MKQPKVVTLPNGLRVMLAPNPDAPTATVLIMVDAGSEHERAEENGVSHFLEHLAFKGTGRHPLPGQVSHELESLGAENNAWTAESHTAYWAKVQSGKAQQILELVSELHLDPLIEEKEVENERGVIIEEIAMYEDRPQSKARDAWQALLYGDQPAGRPIGGTKVSVRGISRAMVADYRARRYRAPGTVVALAGGFDEKAALRFVRQAFAGVDARPAARKARTKETQAAPALRLVDRKSDQAHLILGFRAAKLGDPREHALATLATVLGQGASSRLFIRIREELGAAYYVSAWNDMSPDHGAFGVSVGASLGKVDEVVEAVMAEYRRLTTDLVTPSELRRARDFQIGTFLMGLESSDAIAAHHGEDLLLRGRVVPVRETVSGIRAVTAEDLRRVARKVIREEALNLAGIGPGLREARFKKLLRL